MADGRIFSLPDSEKHLIFIQNPLFFFNYDRQAPATFYLTADKIDIISFVFYTEI